jgi:hypothetical protein
MIPGKGNVQPQGQGVDEASRKLLREIAGDSASVLMGGEFTHPQKMECERIYSLMVRLKDDMERKGKTLVPGSSGSAAMIKLWQAEVQIIEARIRAMVAEIIKYRTGPTGWLGIQGRGSMSNGNFGHATRVPAKSGMSFPGKLKK